MIIGGRKLEISLEDVPIGKLEPNFNQPRRYQLEEELRSKGLSPEIVKKPEGITSSTRFEELVRAIVENSGISMPLVVEKVDDTYKIIDGDRRLGAVNHILNDTKILEKNPSLKDQLASLPCLVVEGPLSDEDRLRLLAHIHIHLANWRPVAKDKVVEDLEKLVSEREKVAAIMGVTPGKVGKSIEVREMAKRFSFKGPSAISYATNLMSLAKRLRDPEVVNTTIQKVKEGKITSPVQIRDLRRIIPNPDAREVYLKPDKSINDALEVVKAKEFEKSLEKPEIEFTELLNRLVTSLKTVTFEELVKHKGSTSVRKMVDDCIALLNNFRSYI